MPRRATQGHCRFNPRAREGRDLDIGSFMTGIRQFQSTRPRGARHFPDSSCSCAARFQSTRPRGARLLATPKPDGSRWFQSTRPRGARLSHHNPSFLNFIVSIHAPARGATKKDFIDALHVVPFQSTRPRGARPDAVKAVKVTCGVSIHAPARGATYSSVEISVSPCCFNPRAREGRDRLPSLMGVAGKSFNPRAREGRDNISKFYLF